MSNSLHFSWDRCSPHHFLAVEHCPHKWRGAALLAIDPLGNLLIIKRADAVPSHRGQLALPGGHRIDDETPEKTALREFSEETGLPPHSIHLIGQLPLVLTARGEGIIPFVGKTTFQWSEVQLPLYREWSFAFSVNLQNLFQTQHWSQGFKFGSGGQHPFFFRSISLREITPCGGHPPEMIFPNPLLLWGATAQMIDSLRLVLTEPCA